MVLRSSSSSSCSSALSSSSPPCSSSSSASLFPLRFDLFLLLRLLVLHILPPSSSFLLIQHGTGNTLTHIQTERKAKVHVCKDKSLVEIKRTCRRLKELAGKCVRWLCVEGESVEHVDGASRGVYSMQMEGGCKRDLAEWRKSFTGKQN